jgi:CIC family chloride channel protein
MRVTAVMKALGTRDAPSADLLRNMVAAGQWIAEGERLDFALRRVDEAGAAFLPVIQPARDGAEPEILGALYHVDALRALNTALAAAAAEEHG